MASDSAGTLRGEGLEAALDAAGIGTWSLALGTGEIAADDAARRLLRLESGTARAGAETLLAAVHPRDRALAIEAFRGALEIEDAPLSPQQAQTLAVRLHDLATTPRSTAPSQARTGAPR
jgi:hypothetical protein